MSLTRGGSTSRCCRTRTDHEEPRPPDRVLPDRRGRWSRRELARRYERSGRGADRLEEFVEKDHGSRRQTKPSLTIKRSSRAARKRLRAWTGPQKSSSGSDGWRRDDLAEATRASADATAWWSAAGRRRARRQRTDSDVVPNAKLSSRDVAHDARPRLARGTSRMKPTAPARC